MAILDLVSRDRAEYLPSFRRQVAGRSHIRRGCPGNQPGPTARAREHAGEGTSVSLSPGRFRTALLALPMLLLPLTGFTPGPQTSEHEARELASFVPKLQEYYSKPTVETSASYDAAADVWRVVLVEEVSGKTVARFAVVDDTARAKNVTVSSKPPNLHTPYSPKRRPSSWRSPTSGCRPSSQSTVPTAPGPSTKTASGRFTSSSRRAGWWAAARGAVIGRRSRASGSTTRPGT